jgi:hypothetical protein
MIRKPNGLSLARLGTLAHQKQHAYNAVRRSRKRAEEKLEFAIAALEQAHAGHASLDELIVMVRAADRAFGDVAHRKEREKSARDTLHFTVSALRLKREQAIAKRLRESPYRLELVPRDRARSA